MAIVRLNHAVLYVRDADRTAQFYGDVLGFREVHRMTMGPGRLGIFMQAPDSENDHDVAFFGLGAGLGDTTAGRDQVGLYHLAWEVATLADLAGLASRLGDVGALVGATDHGTTKALYAKDPDGIEFEVSWVVPASLVKPGTDDGTHFIPLDIDRAIAEFGADTLGRSSSAA